MYGKNGDAVANIAASLQLVYPGQSIEALNRGAQWILQMVADGTNAEHERLPIEEQSRRLETVMFGEGDHSNLRVSPPPGA